MRIKLLNQIKKIENMIEWSDRLGSDETYELRSIVKELKILLKNIKD